MSLRSTPSLSNLTISNKSNPIDLTVDDGDETYDYPRQLKRMRLENITHPNNSTIPLSRSMPSTPSPTPSMSSFTSYNQKPAMAMPNASHNPFMIPSIFTPNPNSSNNVPYRPAFAAPSSFHPPPPVAPSSIPQKRPSGHALDRAVIDLTDSPSPPPQFQRPLPSPTLADLSPKTPVCIGQLTVTALVLYPNKYMMATNLASPQVEWGSVKLQYEHAPKPDGTTDNLNIKTPTGDPFGIVEHKVASSLGHMVGKGLIRLEAKVQKCRSNAPILPLTMLVYTPKGNVPVVGDYFLQCGLLLDHPTSPFSYNDIVSSKTPYLNPHNPPPGGHNRVQYAPNRTLYAGNNGRWSTPAPTGKSVEVQRSQVDELFKNLKSGADLAEMEATPEVATQLYPHQKKALTFLMEREREIKTSAGIFSSMWLMRKSLSGHESWTHIVTEKEVYEEPQESKGAILADDMGLGKTITCVSLIAATLNSALTFASTPLETPNVPWSSSADNSLPAPSQFAGSVWGMPDVSENGASSAKAKAKAQRAQEKLEAEHVRANRIKAKSRATLIICPLSTVSNWEDQFREHWNGEVQVFGGGAGGGAAATALCSQSASQISLTDVQSETKPTRIRDGRSLKVYIYHGNARRPDPAFLADFDAVITTYATLASEFSKQNRSIVTAEAEEEEEGAGSSDGGGVEIDERGNQILRLPKTKKGGVKRKKSGFSASEASSALQSIHWFRVVLDEAHCIKETGTVGSRASCDLMADRRLCLTGTPVQNKLDDVFALIKFLRLQPLDDKAVWTEFIGTPVKFGQTIGIVRLQGLMKTITLRRTKESKTLDGKRILSLPPRRDELRLLKFDAQEQEIYDQFFTASKAEFNEMSDKNEVMKNYVGILQKILRLRQICDHFELVEGKDMLGQDNTLSYEDIIAAVAKEGFTTSRAIAIFAILKESATTQCVECGSELCTSSGEAQDDMDDLGPKKTKKNKASSSKAPTRASSPSVPRPILTRCQHLFCFQCYRQCIHPSWPNVAPDIYRSCSACQTGLCPADAIEIKSEYLEGSTSKKKPARKEKRQRGTGSETCHPSTKIKALLGDLIQFSRTNPYSSNYDPDSIEVQMVDEKGVEVDEGVVKTVVFSQWTTMLDKIEEALESAAIRFDRLDGTMKRDERIRAMDALKYDPACEVLLVSLKAGGVGLNLTAAQRVYLMDPYWNPAVENQAVDRIHRLGQTRPVTTVKLIIENSIEARLLEVQKKKTELANMTLGSNFSKSELMARRMEELNQLFGS